MAEQAPSLNHEDAVGRAAGATDFRLGEALIQPSLNRISVGGHTTQVEPKIMRVLQLLATRPGGVVTRGQFLDAVWGDTGGDDYLLNRAISELRKIFGDDAGEPRYIETIRKTGYRLVAAIAPVTVAALVERPPQDLSSPWSAKLAALTQFAPKRVALAGLALVVGFATVVTALIMRPGQGDEVVVAPSAGAAFGQVLPLTSLVGQEVDPALSPDGTRVAFAWNGGAGDSFDLYIKTLDSQAQLRLTENLQSGRYPVWSPDGGEITFARTGALGTDFMRISSIGGPARRIASDSSAASVRGMSLTPDGQVVVYAARESALAPYRLIQMSLHTGERHVLTQPTPGTLGDIDPRFAADGRAIAFVRADNEVTKDVFITSSNGDAVRRLTFDNRKVNGIAWGPSDHQRIMFPSTRDGMYRVWSVSADGGQPQLVGLGGEDVQRPATIPGVDAVVFERWTHQAQLRVLDLNAATPTNVEPLGVSTRWDSHPSFEPGGKRIVFTSNRAGAHGLWISDRDGDNAVEIADLGGAFIDHPAWSPDGQWIAFDASPQGRTNLFVIAPEGGTAQAITSAGQGARNPSWSRDSQWIYFERQHDGIGRVFAQPVAGGPAVQVTTESSANPAESLDGAWMWFSKPDQHGLWRTPRADWSAEDAPLTAERMIADLDRRDGANWVVASDGVYFVRRRQDQDPVLSKWREQDRSIIDVLTLPPAFEGWGFALSPDESEILYAQLLARESDLGVARLEPQSGP